MVRWATLLLRSGKSFSGNDGKNISATSPWNSERSLPHWQRLERLGMYTYKSEIVKVIDADTVDAFCDTGFRHYTKQRFRLAGIDAPEMNTEAGKRAKAWLLAYFNKHGSRCIIESKKADSFGRWLAFIRVKGVLLNDELIKAGHAVKYLK